MLTEEGLDLRRTTREEKAEQIRQAAFMFARVTRDVNEIAAALGGVSSRTVQRLMNNPGLPRGVGPTRLPGRAAFSQGNPRETAGGA